MHSQAKKLSHLGPLFDFKGVSNYLVLGVDREVKSQPSEVENEELLSTIVHSRVSGSKGVFNLLHGWNNFLRAECHSTVLEPDHFHVVHFNDLDINHMSEYIEILF
jgi:hypothetical protein